MAQRDWGRRPWEAHGRPTEKEPAPGAGVMSHLSGSDPDHQKSRNNVHARLLQALLRLGTRVRSFVHEDY